MKESKLREMSRRALSSNLLGLFVVLILMCVVFTILKPGFLTGKNLLNILTAASLSGLIAIGESYLIIAGQIDLSPGAIAAFAGVFSALLAQRGMPILLIILITVAVGALFGAVSAFQVNALKIQPFIATLAVMSIARGLAYIICAGKPVFISHNTYIKIGITRILGIPLPVIILVVMFLVWGVALSKTRFGRNVYAVGGNPAAARLAGINADAVKRGLFILSSCLASLGGDHPGLPHEHRAAGRGERRRLRRDHRLGAGRHRDDRRDRLAQRDLFGGADPPGVQQRPAAAQRLHLLAGRCARPADDVCTDLRLL